MIHVLAIAMACAAFLMLAVSMKRHQRDLVGRAVPEARAKLARIAGWLLIALCWALEGWLLGPALGTIVWIGEISMGAWLAIAVIDWRSGRITR